VRGLGGSACDPSEHTCSFDLKKYRESKATDESQRLRDAGLCDVCQVFGATGWRRRFGVEVHTVEGEIDPTEGMFPSGRIHPKGRDGYRVGGWFLRGGYHGILELEFTGDKNILWCEILPVLLFVEEWANQSWREFLMNRGDNSSLNFQQCSGLVGRWWWEEQTSNGTYYGILPALTNMFFAKVRFHANSEDWWKQLREIQWIEQRAIRENEATWTGNSQQHPSGPYRIPNPLPFARLERWVAHHNTFPIAPILRTLLRYGSFSICDENGETFKCKFLFGTTQGRGEICGYCGTPVRPDKNNRNRQWCNTGKASLRRTLAGYQHTRPRSLLV